MEIQIKNTQTEKTHDPEVGLKQESFGISGFIKKAAKSMVERHESALDKALTRHNVALEKAVRGIRVRGEQAFKNLDSAVNSTAGKISDSFDAATSEIAAEAGFGVETVRGLADYKRAYAKARVAITNLGASAEATDKAKEALQAVAITLEKGLTEQVALNTDVAARRSNVRANISALIDESVAKTYLLVEAARQGKLAATKASTATTTNTSGHASDTEGSAPANVVTLLAGQGQEPLKTASPVKSRALITANDPLRLTPAEDEPLRGDELSDPIPILTAAAKEPITLATVAKESGVTAQLQGSMVLRNRARQVVSQTPPPPPQTPPKLAVVPEPTVAPNSSLRTVTTAADIKGLSIKERARLNVDIAALTKTKLQQLFKGDAMGGDEELAFKGYSRKNKHELVEALKAKPERLAFAVNHLGLEIKDVSEPTKYAAASKASGAASTTIKQS